MATEPQHRNKRNAELASNSPPALHSVWVGSLKNTVTEAELQRAFSALGAVQSCSIKRDDTGNSRGFAYISYLTVEEAESAALAFNGFNFHGSAIKTKGPKTLQLEGHSPHPPKRDTQNYRPYTDCSFFMQGNQCKKGNSCPYRHSVMARDSPIVCSDWMERLCLNMDCPRKHPGNKEPSVMVESKQEGLACGGQCGVPKCRSYFESKEGLKQHVEETQLLKCPSCSSVFQSDPEFLKHLHGCYGNNQSGYEWPSLGAESGIKFGSNSHSPSTNRQRTYSGSEDTRGSHSNQLEPTRSASSSDFRDIGAGHPDTSANIGLGDLEYSYDSEDDDVTYSSGEIARLLSLNEKDMQEEEEEDEEVVARSSSEGVKTEVGAKKRGSSSKQDKKLAFSPSHSRAKEPVGVFWDIENCSVPPNKSAFVVASKLRKEFISGKREAEFMCVCDITKERKEVTDDLNKAQVTLVHVNAIAKNAADDKIRQSLRRFANTYPPPATVVLISGDVNFSTELNDLMNCHNLTVVLVHNSQASNALKAFASQLVNYDHFIEDVEPPAKQQNPSDLPRVVAVKGLPKHVSQGQLYNRLGRLSDNCGGKVLRVDMNSGSAKVLFRTNELAIKAQKRMNSEDVFGYKISTSVEMEPNPPAHPNNNRASSSNFQNLSGSGLGQSYPPPSHKPPNQVPAPNRTPPLPSRQNVVMRPPYPAVRPPQPLLPSQPYQRPLMVHPQVQPQVQPYFVHPNGFPVMGGRVPNQVGPRPMPPFDPRVQPRAGPPLVPMPHPSQGPIIRGPRPVLPMGTNQLPRFKNPPCANTKSLRVGPIPRHEGRILVFKVMPDQEVHMEENVQSLQCEAFFSAQHRVLWHSYSEIQVLFKLDFIQTAMIRKEEIIQVLYEEGNLPVKIAEEFVETCTKSIADVFRRHKCNWEVTMCGWTAEEEENRVVRSNALAVLHSRQPSTWINFSDFKSLYQQRYSTAISELSIHTSCAGALQILSSSSNTNSKNQVVIIYEFSPLVKIVNDVKLHEKLRVDFSRFLSCQPQRRIRLLDFVAAYRRSNIGPLPLSPTGKILQDVLSSTPNVELEGGEPANTYVTLKHLGAARHPGTAMIPKNFAELTADFHKLLKSKGRDGISTKFIQQEYQTFFHHSFRVSDYLPDANGMQDLLKEMPGIKVVNVTLTNGKKDKRVFLEESSSFSTKTASSTYSQLPTSRQKPQQQQMSTLPPATPRSPRVEGTPKMKPMSELNNNFRELLKASPNRCLPFKGFQQCYQTHFHVSFKISTYMTGDVKMKDLLGACPGVAVIVVDGEEHVCLAEEVEVIKSKKRAAQNSISKPVSPSPVKVGSGTNLSMQADEGALKPTEDNIMEFRKDCVEVLNTTNGHCLLAQFPEHYRQVKGVKFQPSIYKAKKLLQLLECIGSYVEVFNENREMKLIDMKRQCEEELVALVYAQKDHRLTLDRVMSSYEAMFGHKLSFHGHPKLLKLLESFPDSLKIFPGGSDRVVSLMPLRCFSCEMGELLPRHPSPMPINKIVPSYKEHFGKDLVVTTYGHPKLIKLLEAIPDVLEINGSGATRTVTLRKNLTRPPAYKSSSASDVSPVRRSPSVSDASPAPVVVVDEVVALLMSTHAQKLSLSELTKKYNASFRRGSLPIDQEKLLQVIKRLPNFQVSGMGPVCYVQLATQDSKPPLMSSNKPLIGQAGEAFAAVQEKKTEPPEHRGRNLGGSTSQAVGGTADTMAGAKNAVSTGGFDPNIETYKNMPEFVDDEGMADISDTDSTCSSSSSWMEEGDEGKRMVNETRRLLLTHQEHAMTLAELVDSFHAQEDPSNITVQNLYRYLENDHGKKFQVSVFTENLRASMVQLDSKDCLWKLGEDLLQLFIYKPSHDLSLPLDSIASLYQECYSKKLVTAVYSAKNLEQVLRSKALKKVIHVDPMTKVCSPCESYKIQVLVSLLVELLFFKGDECSSEDSIPAAFHRYFGEELPLTSLNLNSVSAMFKLPDVQKCIKCVQTKARKLKPVLKPRSVFIEQIRHLLALNDGRFALNQFNTLYTDEFGPPQSEEVSVFLRKGRLPHFGLRVVNYASLKWAVWAANGYPVPPHRLALKRKHSLQLDFSVLDDPLLGHTTFNAIQREASDVIDRISELPATTLMAAGRSADPSSPETLPPVSKARPTPVMAGSPKACLSNLSCTSSVPTSSSGNTGEAYAEQNSNDESGMLATAYDFLKDDPELLARLSEQPEGTMAAIIDTSSMPEDDVKILAEALDLQRLQDIPRMPRSTDDNLVGSSHKTGEKLAGSGVLVPPHVKSGNRGTGLHGSGSSSDLPLLVNDGPIDFLKEGLDPEQVLDQLQKLKEASGGSLKPDQMNPFFDYFGELSSRELDRIEKLEAQSNPHKKIGNGEARKKKRNMAIRFPSQSNVASPPSSVTGRGPSLSDLKFPVGPLPAANFDDLSSGDDCDDHGGPIKPYNREELVREALKKTGQDVNVTDLLGDDGTEFGGLSRPPLAGSLLSSEDLNNLSRLDSAVNEMESFLLREQDP